MGGGNPGDYVHVTTGVGSGWGGHLETVDVNPGAGSESWRNPGDCGCGTSGTGSRWWGHPVDCGHVTQNGVSGEESDSGDCGHMTRVYGLGGGHRGYFRHLTPGADGNCSHEIKRCLLLERKVMPNLDSILKSRDIALPTKVHLVKAMVFPVVMYGCESWTVKKAEH